MVLGATGTVLSMRVTVVVLESPEAVEGFDDILCPCSIGTTSRMSVVVCSKEIEAVEEFGYWDPEDCALYAID